VTATQHLSKTGHSIRRQPETTGRGTANDRIRGQLSVSNHPMQTCVGETREEWTLWHAKEPGPDVLGGRSAAGWIEQTSAGTTDLIDRLVRTAIGADDA
jgi:hypothetical protein